MRRSALMHIKQKGLIASDQADYSIGFLSGILMRQ
jgi:hypothetical protein